MPPAISPASSEASPSVAETVWASDDSNDSGSEPYAQDAGEVLRLGLAELARDLGGAEDRALDRGRGDDLAVQHEGDVLADVLGV